MLLRIAPGWKCLELGLKMLLSRRISLAMLAGFVLKAIAANCEPLPIGPWDRRPKPTAGRLTNYLDIQLHNFVALALAGVKSRNYTSHGYNLRFLKGLSFQAGYF